jgi:hypothetical protein
VIDRLRSTVSSAVSSTVSSAVSSIPRVAATVPRAAASVPRAVASLYDKAIDRVLSHPYEVTTADEARAVLDDPDAIDVSAFADQIQQVALMAMPLLRRVGKFKSLPGVKRMPWVLSLVTVANLTRSVREGVREVQVVGSYLAARLHAATGAPPDPDLVKRLTVQVYLSPTHRLDPTATERVPTEKLLRRWLVNGMLGRTSNKAAVRAIGAVERLDMSELRPPLALSP